MVKLNLSDSKDKTLIILNGSDITDSVLEYSVNRNAKKKIVLILH